MKGILRAAIGLISIISVTTATADNLCCDYNVRSYNDDLLCCLYPWFVGIDYKYLHVRTRADWRKEFYEGYSTGNVYAGFKFNRFIGVELGFEQTQWKTQSYTYQSGEDFFGNDVSGFSSQQRLRYQIWHLDVNYYVPLQCHFEFFASFGPNFVIPKVQQTLFSFGEANQIEVALSQMRFINRWGVRGRAGVQYFVTERIGIRGLLGVDVTSQIRLKGYSAELFESNGIRPRPFKETLSALIGIFIMLG